MTWFTADLHFGHTNVIRYSKRPFKTVQEMDETLFNNWNKTISEHDLVYVLGDISFQKYAVALEMIPKLKGRKILVQGNHDKFSIGQYHKLGFEHVFQDILMKMGKHRVRLCHYPYRAPWYKRILTRATYNRYIDRRPPRDADFLLHGHVHTAFTKRKSQINVGVDCWGGFPVSISEIQSLVDGKEDYIKQARRLWNR